MSFLYPRTITIYRAALVGAGSSGFGAQPYQEAQAKTDVPIWSTTPVFAGIQCSIQESREGNTPAVGLPGDTKTQPTIKIFIPLGSLALGSVLARDYVLDDLGVRYQVTNPYWNSLGYRLLCGLTEA